MFREELDHDAELMSGLIHFLKEDKRLQNAWLERDRDELLHAAEPLFEDIRSLNTGLLISTSTAWVEPVSCASTIRPGMEII